MSRILKTLLPIATIATTVTPCVTLASCGSEKTNVNIYLKQWGGITHKDPFRLVSDSKYMTFVIDYSKWPDVGAFPNGVIKFVDEDATPFTNQPYWAEEVTKVFVNNESIQKGTGFDTNGAVLTIKTAPVAKAIVRIETNVWCYGDFDHTKDIYVLAQ